jgi:glutamyl-tRNA(Gln) amidotransferase subunit D
MNVYSAGIDLQRIGVHPLDDILPETAFVKLMWVLGQTTDRAEIVKMMRTNYADEYNPRRPAGEKHGRID